LTIFPKSVGTTEEKIVEVQRNRTSLVFQSNTTNTIYLKEGKGASTTNGLVLRPYAVISLKIPEDDPSNEWWAIASGASSDLRIYEGYGRI